MQNETPNNPRPAKIADDMFIEEFASFLHGIETDDLCDILASLDPADIAASRADFAKIEAVYGAGGRPHLDYLDYLDFTIEDCYNNPEEFFDTDSLLYPHYSEEFEALVAAFEQYEELVGDLDELVTYPPADGGAR
jgi:hypothetical protein